MLTSPERWRITLVSQRYFTSFVHPMQSKALQPSFHRALAFLQWQFVLEVKYQVEFCKAVTSHLKFILSNNKAKLCFIYNVMRFTKIQFCSQGCYLIDFVDTTTTVRNFLRTEELISSFFKKTVKNELSFFYLGKLIHF